MVLQRLVISLYIMSVGDDSKVDRNGRRLGLPPRFYWNDATAFAGFQEAYF